MAVKQTEADMRLEYVAERGAVALAAPPEERTGWLRVLRREMRWLKVWQEHR